MKLVETTPAIADPAEIAPEPAAPKTDHPAATLPTAIFEPPAPNSQTFEAMDRALHAGLARLTRGISPIVLWRAYLDWLGHLSFSPGKQAELADEAFRKALRFALHAGRAVSDPAAPPCIQPLPQDHRFAGEAWQSPPSACTGRASS